MTGVVGGAVAEIQRAAAGVQAIGDDVRRLAGSVLELASLGWESSAAAEFRDRLGAEAVRVRTAADRVDDAALALRRHARAVDGAVGEAVDRVWADLPGELGAIRRRVGGEIGRLIGGFG